MKSTIIILLTRMSLTRALSDCALLSKTLKRSSEGDAIGRTSGNTSIGAVIGATVGGQTIVKRQFLNE